MDEVQKRTQTSDFYSMLSTYDTEAIVGVLSGLNLAIYNHVKKTGSSVLNVDLYKAKVYTTQERYYPLGNWSVRDTLWCKLIRPQHQVKVGKRVSSTVHELVQLISMFVDVETDITGGKICDANVMAIIYGLGEHQFGAQTQNYRLAEKRNRTLIDKYSEGYFDAEEAVRAIVGVSRLEFDLSIEAVFDLADKHSICKPYDYPDRYLEDKGLNRASYERVVKYYTAKPKDVEGKALNDVRSRYVFADTETAVYISDIFKVRDLRKDGLLWVVKEHCKAVKSDPQHFPNNFGYMFEDYVADLMREYLVGYTYYNIDKNEGSELFKTELKKKADFLILTSKYRLVIECKSGARSIDVKDVYNNVEAIKRYHDKVLGGNKAGKQLSKTIEALNTDENRETVGIVLTFEESHSKNRLKMEYIKAEEYPESYKGYLMVDILEYELLLKVMQYDEKTADEILTEFVEENKKEGPRVLDFLSYLDPAMQKDKKLETTIKQYYD